MLQINHPYSSIESLRQEISSLEIDRLSKSILIQLFTSILDIDVVQKQISEILTLFPNATLIGASSDGEIVDGEMVEKSIVLSISVFEKTDIISAYMIKDDSNELGLKIGEKIISPNSRCIICFADGLKHNGDIFLEALNQKNRADIPIAGGMAADANRFVETFCIYQDRIFSGGCVAVSLDGDELEVYNDYNLGWRAVGPVFTITKSTSNKVYEIDNRPVLDIYKEVLGDSIMGSFPASIIDFPLIKKSGDILIARSAISLMDDGSVVYAGNINEGDLVQFGMGSSKLVNQYNNLDEVEKNDIQASFIYSCSARKKFLGDKLEDVFKQINQLSPTSGFFTYGEFFNSVNHSSFLNITTTLLFLNEKGTKNKFDTRASSLKKTEIKATNKDDILFHFIDYMTSQLEEKEKKISKAQQLADEYINAIDSTLIVSKTDALGKIIFVNDKFEKISGYTKDELLGKSHSIVRHPSNSAELFKDLWDTIESGKIWEGSFANMRKDGTTYYVSSAVIPIHDTKGEIVEYLAIREDVSELVDAKLRAEHAEANQAAFLANMSHEIRTPMNGILGFSELLIETKLDKTQNEYVNIIENSTKTLINIVNDILDFSKIKSEKIHLEKIEMDLVHELRNATLLLNSLADKKSVTYKKVFDDKITHFIHSDPTRLKQVITNLISNAIKFTPNNGEVSFSLKVIKDDVKKQTIRFSIKDNGIGIPKDKQEIIFSPYAQAQDSTTREYGGTGLGLSISKSFVEAFGGELMLDSKEGVGSEFYFDLDFELSDKKSASPILKNEGNIPQKDAIANANLRILIAEDYEVNRTFINLIFSKYGIKPDFAFDGLEAVEKSKNSSYDIIFMDINMPNMGGMEATQNIRKYDTHTPIIALTANTLDGDREKFLSIGMDDYLSKPLDRKKLQNLLLKYSYESEPIPCLTNENGDEIQENILEIDSILDKIKIGFSNFNEQIIMKLVNTFINSTEVSLEELKKAIVQNDYKSIEMYAHKIAGSAGNLKLTHMYENAKVMEIDAAQEISINYMENYKKIKRCFDKLKSELD